MNKSLFDRCGVKEYDRFLIEGGEMQYGNGSGEKLEAPEVREGFVLREVKALDSTYIEDDGVLVELVTLYAYCNIAHSNAKLDEDREFFHDTLQRLLSLVSGAFSMLFFKHFGVRIERRDGNYHLRDTGEVATPENVLARVNTIGAWSEGTRGLFGCLFPDWYDIQVLS